MDHSSGIMKILLTLLALAVSGTLAQMGPENPTIDLEKPNFLSENRPMEPVNPALDPRNQLVGPVNPPMGPGNQPVGPVNPVLDPGNQPVGPVNPALDPGNQPAGPVNPALDLGNQIVGPGNPAFGPGNQPVGPVNPAIDTGNQLVGPVNPALGFGDQPVGQVNPPSGPGNLPDGPVNPASDPGNQLVGPVNPALAPGNQPVGPVTPPLDAGNQLVGPVNPALGAGNQPVGPVNSASDPGNQLVGPGNPAFGPGNQPVGPVNPAMDSGNQLVGPVNPALGPGNQPVGPVNPPSGPGNQPAGPVNPALDPGNQPMGPLNPALDLGNKPVVPVIPALYPGNQPVVPGGPSLYPGIEAMGPRNPAMGSGQPATFPAGLPAGPEIPYPGVASNKTYNRLDLIQDGADDNLLVPDEAMHMPVGVPVDACLSIGESFYEEAQRFPDASNELGLALTQLLIRDFPSANVCLSPVSIAVQLAFLLCGAGARTKQQLLQVSGFQKFGIKYKEIQDTDMLRTIIKQIYPGSGKGMDIYWATRMFIGMENSLKTDMYDVMDDFRIDFQYVNFGLDDARKDFDLWLSAKQPRLRHETPAHEKDIWPMDPDTKLALASYMLFQGYWKRPFLFSKNQTKEQDFHLFGQETRKVQMMSLENQRLRYLDDSELNYRFLEIPYAKGYNHTVRGTIQGEKSMSLLLALPKDVNSPADLAMTPGIWCRVKLAMRFTVMREVKLPRFEARGAVNLRSALSRLGLQDLFDYRFADMSGFNEAPGPLPLDAMIHVAALAVDERGTDGDGKGAEKYRRPVDPLSSRGPTFVADHPFRFFVVDDFLEFILLSGKVANPAL